MSERELQNAIKEFLRRAGWEVIVNSKHVKALAQERDKPDLIAFRHDVTLLVECKSESGQLRPGQAAFRERMKTHLGPHLKYVAPHSFAEFMMEYESYYC